jgi:hypothetical protein
VSVAVKAARRALIAFESRFPDDKRPRATIEAAERWLEAPNTVNASLAVARAALARNAASAAAFCFVYASDAAYAAAYAAVATADADYASDAAYAAAYAAIATAAYAAYAVGGAAYDASCAVEREAQRADLIALISEV